MVIDKTPEGIRSPNLADALMIAYAPAPHRMGIMTDEALAATSVPVLQFGEMDYSMDPRY